MNRPRDREIRIFVERSDNSGVKSISIKLSRLVALAIALAVLFSVSILILAFGLRGMVRKTTLAALRLENQSLISQLKEFRNRVKSLESRMEVLKELQNRAHLLADLDPISDDVWKVGIGGPGLVMLEKFYPDSVFLDVESDLDRMIRQSELQLESYREVIAVLEREREMRACTPSIRPLRGGFLSSRFGRRMDPFSDRVVFHPGVDYRARSGTPVMATADGVVRWAGRNGGFGLMIEIDHGNGFKSRYAHLSKILVSRGQKLKRGEIIGLVGNTGHSTGSHLHYEVLHMGINRDPLQYILPEELCYD